MRISEIKGDITEVHSFPRGDVPNVTFLFGTGHWFAFDRQTTSRTDGNVQGEIPEELCPC